MYTEVKVMTNNPIEVDFKEFNNQETNAVNSKFEDTYGYDENIAAKLGGNYSKMVEFYENRL
jgi:hypothetical protein